jgi:hypothetical protein
MASGEVQGAIGQGPTAESDAEGSRDVDSPLLGLQLLPPSASTVGQGEDKGPRGKVTQGAERQGEGSRPAKGGDKPARGGGKNGSATPAVINITQRTPNGMHGAQSKAPAVSPACSVNSQASHKSHKSQRSQTSHQTQTSQTSQRSQKSQASTGSFRRVPSSSHASEVASEPRSKGGKYRPLSVGEEEGLYVSPTALSPASHASHVHSVSFPPKSSNRSMNGRGESAESGRDLHMLTTVASTPCGADLTRCMCA